MGKRRKITKLNFHSFGSMILILILTVYFLYAISHNTFDSSQFEGKNVYKHVEELSSPAYEGRRAGTNGNRMALEYIEKFFRDNGLEPAGEDNTYYQRVETLLPFYNSEPKLNVVDGDGSLIESLRVGVDFREVLTGYGGVGKATGKIINTDRTLTSYEQEDLRGKIILLSNYPQDKEIEYGIQSGAVGIVYIGGGVEAISIPNLSKKPGKTIILAKVSRLAYQRLVSYSKEGALISADYNVSFNMANTPNILAKIEGRKKDGGYTIISAVVDGYGMEAEGRYFPGAVHNASGTAFMMELARTVKAQKALPERTIIFIGWNDSIEPSRQNGIKHYADNPLYPLNKSKVLILERLGGTRGGNIIIDYNEAPGKALAQKLASLSEDANTVLRPTDKYVGLSNDIFVKKGAPAVILEQSYTSLGGFIFGTGQDNIGRMNIEEINRASQMLLNFVKMELYKDVFTGLLTQNQIIITLIFFLGIILFYFIELLYRFYSNIELGRFKLEDLYYSVTYNLLVRIYKLIVPLIIVLLVLAFITNVPSDFNIFFGKDSTFTNISFSHVLKKSIAHLENLLTHGLGNSVKGYPAIKVVWYSFSRSFVMVFLTTLLSFILGTWRGTLEGFKQRERSNLRIIKSLSLLSLPDVFIVLVVQLLLVFMHEKGLGGRAMDIINTQRFLIPFLCLSIIPTIYISQIAYVVAREEMRKDYIRAARAKGLSRGDILRRHLLRGVIMKVMDSMQSVLTIIISNLIIVEIMFGYPSISSNLIDYMKERDINVVVGLVLALGLIYIIFTLFFKLLSRLINPFKREGIN